MKLTQAQRNILQSAATYNIRIYTSAVHTKRTAHLPFEQVNIRTVDTLVNRRLLIRESITRGADALREEYAISTLGREVLKGVR